MDVFLKVRRSIHNISKATCISSIILVALISSTNAQSILGKSEKKIIKDINSLLISIQAKNSSRITASKETLENYGKSVMKNIKGFKMVNDRIFPDDIVYSKDSKIKKKKISQYVSFKPNISHPDQYYVSHSIFYLPDADINDIYIKTLNGNFGNRIGTLCEGDPVYGDSLTQGYILLRNSQPYGSPYMLIYPKEFIVSSINNITGSPFKEKIIYDAFPVMNDFTKLKEDLKGNDNFVLEHSSSEKFLFNLNFFKLIKKEYDEYLKNNLDELQSNPNVTRFYSIVDSLKLIKKKELNIQRFSIGSTSNSQQAKHNAKQISLSIMLYSNPANKQQEMDLLSNKISYWIAEAKLADLSTPLNQIFKKMRTDVLASDSYEITTGNYIIKANRLGLFSHWSFVLNLKACE